MAIDCYSPYYSGRLKKTQIFAQWNHQPKDDIRCGFLGVMTSVFLLLCLFFVAWILESIPASIQDSLFHISRGNEKHGLGSHQDGHQSIFIGICVICVPIYVVNSIVKPLTIYGAFPIHSGDTIGMVYHWVYRHDGSVTTPLSPCHLTISHNPGLKRFVKRLTMSLDGRQSRKHEHHHCISL